MSVNASNSQNSCGTCGENSPGPGADIEQNNIPRRIRLTRYTLNPDENVTIAQVVERLNGISFSISPIETPVTVAYSVLSLAAGSVEAVTRLYFFNAGKGTYGSGGTAVVDGNLSYITTQGTTTQDIENSSNTVFIDLGVLPDGDYLTAANGEGRDLSDPDKIYFFTYIKDGQNYLVKVQDAEGYYGGDYENQLTAENLIPSGVTQEAEPVDQDNIDIKQSYITSIPLTLSGVAGRVNSGDTFTVSEKESLWIFVNTRGTFNNPGTTAKYKVFNKGKGTYGLLGNKTIAAGDLQLFWETPATPADVADDPETDTFQFGNLTSLTISQWLNTKISPLIIQPQNEGYTLFKGTVNGDATTYLWTGVSGIYGSGRLQSSELDFQIFSESETGNPTTLILGETDTTAYRGDRGAAAYTHSLATGNPHGTQMGDIPNLVTWLNDRLIGSRAADSDLQVTTAPITQNKYVDSIRMFNLLAWFKTQAATISGGWNFTGSLKKNGVDVATVADIGALNFSLEFGQLNPVLFISFNAKVAIDGILLIRAITSVAEYQMYTPTAIGIVRTTLAAINADINALTTSQGNAGFTIRIKCVITAGESIGMATLKAHTI